MWNLASAARSFIAFEQLNFLISANLAKKWLNLLKLSKIKLDWG
jgi:hypothetical protein